MLSTPTTPLATSLRDPKGPPPTAKKMIKLTTPMRSTTAVASASRLTACRRSKPSLMTTVGA